MIGGPLGGTPIRALAALAAAAAVLAAGCGGSDDQVPTTAPTTKAPTGAAEPTVESYIEALRDGDAEAGCALYSEQGVQVSIDRVEGTEYESQSCEELFGKVASAFEQQLEGASAETFVESKKHATVAVKAADGTSPFALNLTKEDGEWKISDTLLPNTS